MMNPDSIPIRILHLHRFFRNFIKQLTLLMPQLPRTLRGQHHWPTCKTCVFILISLFIVISVFIFITVVYYFVIWYAVDNWTGGWLAGQPWYADICEVKGWLKWKLIFVFSSFYRGWSRRRWQPIFLQRVCQKGEESRSLYLWRRWRIGWDGKKVVIEWCFVEKNWGRKKVDWFCYLPHEVSWGFNSLPCVLELQLIL